jgi:biotin synthase
MKLETILNKPNLEFDDIVAILAADSDEDHRIIEQTATRVLNEYIGNKVFFRGLIEFSNICTCDCLYCGIRKSNTHYERYTLTKEEILESAKWIAREGYGSLVLQSGERRDAKFIDFLCDVVESIKRETRSADLPEGLGITLSTGEQSEEIYRKLYSAGAHRYLLRIETTNRELFARIHPPEIDFDRRLESLRTLIKVGFQVGTGVMIGLPGQTVADLARDILFFRDMDIDMIGMGPYISHKDTPMSVYFEENQNHIKQIYRLALRMIGATRIALKDVNIAATTALQAIDPLGREAGLRFGANVLMPQTTPIRVRKDYLLYEGKPCVEDSTEMCKFCLEQRIDSVGREIARNEWGDPKHFATRRMKNA